MVKDSSSELWKGENEKKRNYVMAEYDPDSDGEVYKINIFKI